MIHKIVATVLIVHSRHTGSSTPGTTILPVTGVVVILGRILLEIVTVGTVVGCIMSCYSNIVYCSCSNISASDQLDSVYY